MSRAWLRKIGFSSLLVVLIAGGTVVSGSAQQKLVPIKFSPTVSVYALPYLVAYEAGIFKKNGIDLQPTIEGSLVKRVARSGIQIPGSIVGTGNDVRGAVFPGDQTGARQPLTMGGEAPGIYSAARTPRPRAVDTTVVIASHYDFTHWLFIARKDITTPEQLKGKRIGYSSVGTISWFMALVFCKKMGWDCEQDVSLISDSIDLDNLRAGLVDAIITSETVAIMGKAEGFNQVVDMRDARWREPMASNSLQVDRAWLRDNRDTAVGFVKSLVEGIALMKRDKAATVAVMVKWYNWTDPKEQDELYAYAMEYPEKPYPAVAGIKKAMEVYDNLAMHKFKPEDFYDDSIVRELDKSGYIDSLYK